MSLSTIIIRLIKRTFRQRFLLAKLTKIPGLRKFVDFLLFDGDEIYYLPKDQEKTKVITINKKIPSQENVVLASEIVDYFIEKSNFHWIMNFCICRTSENCKNYPKDLGCLFMGEAVLKIDKSIGKLVTKEEAKEHVKKCREKGLVHLIGRNKIDTQWLNVRPGNKLLTVCNCCECCCLWRMIPNLDNKIRRKITKLPGIEILVNDNCVLCGDCLEDICFVNAISIGIDKVTIDNLMCRGCGRCIEICKNNAIELIVENYEYVQKTIKRISSLVDVT